MDTPKSKASIDNNSNKLIISSTSDSPAFQDSPVFKYISDLSPIQPVKADPGAHGFLGLASPPLVFASPRINSLTSLLNRKLHTSGSNSESLQDGDKTQKNDGYPVSFQAYHSPSINEQKACDMKKLTPLACSSPSGCIDDFLTDPIDSANSSCKRQSDDAPQPSEGGCLEKLNSCTDEDMHLNKSTLHPAKENAQPKSTIITRLVKNDARHLISSSSECLVTLPRPFANHTSEACQTGDSSNEASHLERGTLRRCLFDENEKKYLENSELWNPSDNSNAMQPNISSTRAASNGEINLSQRATGTCISSVDGNKKFTISKPLGIGLHLNSVVYPRTMNNSNISQQSFVARVEGASSVNDLRNQPDGNASETRKVPAGMEERPQNNGCSVGTSDDVIASDVTKQIYNPVTASNLNEHNAITYPKRKSSSELAESHEEANQVSPKNKRKKASSGNDDTTKRCNCKKTKCLKLYCDCFAAGFYCAESCACQGCFNRPEFEETVMETRQQIESRNPLAFAPKVVPVAESPISNKEVGNLSTPSSARHKRGCNCKKSMCLKKYCECYQANVGCSEGCRCEGCKNVYGIREDYSIAREFIIRKTAEEMSEAVGSQEMSTVGSNYLNSRVHKIPSLTVATPALQCSDLKKNALKSRLPFRRFLQTPDSHRDRLTSEENFSTYSGNSQSHNMLLEKSGEPIDGASLDAEKCQENTDDRAQSAGDEATSVSCSTHMSNSAVYMIQSSSPKPSILRNNSPPQLFAEITLPPLNSSLRWRGSPVTPITQAFQDIVSGSKASDMIEDDTPDILKDSPSPIISVKVSSPNKKRISPPHNSADCSGFLNTPTKSMTVSSPNKKRVSSPHNPTDSGNLKISRKFVLRSLPSFPSLTPYSKNSNKDSIHESSDM